MWHRLLKVSLCHIARHRLRYDHNLFHLNFPLELSHNHLCVWCREELRELHYRRPHLQDPRKKENKYRV